MSQGEGALTQWVLALIFVSTVLLTLWVALAVSSRERPLGRRLARIRSRAVRTPPGAAWSRWFAVEPASAGSAPAEEPTPRTRGNAGRRALSFRTRISEALERPLKATHLGRGLALELRKADLKLRVSEFYFLSLGAGLLAFLFALAVTRSPVAGLLALCGGAGVPRQVVRAKKNGRAKSFDRQLPDALNMISSALRSGYSLLQAMSVVAREMPAPIGEEFSRVVRESQFNIPVEDAMANLAERVESLDLDLAITAMIIQRQVGGNLSEVLDNITQTIRERIRITGEVNTLTAQGRVSGWIVALLPVGLAAVTYLINPGYILPLFTHPLGRFILALAAGMQLIGLVIIRRIVNVQV
jgi:tight adherence protein B